MKRAKQRTPDAVWGIRYVRKSIQYSLRQFIGQRNTEEMRNAMANQLMRKFRISYPSAKVWREGDSLIIEWSALNPTATISDNC